MQYTSKKKIYIFFCIKLSFILFYKVTKSTILGDNNNKHSPPALCAFSDDLINNTPLQHGLLI